MSSLLKLSIMALGAACVLLLAGGFPLMGTPEVYRGGVMLLLGLVSTLLCLWGAWRIAVGQRVRLVFGLVFLFFAGIGLVMLWSYASQGFAFAQQGGPMWMGALAMFCTALSGVVFFAVFGYLTYRVMTHRLWLAGIHAALALLAIGVYVDYKYEVRTMLTLPADGTVTADSVRTRAGEVLSLGFSLKVESFAVSHYDNVSYTLYTMEQGRPVNPIQPEVQGNRLVAGDESWDKSLLKTAPGMQHPFYLVPGSPPRVILQNPPAVKDYCAACVVNTDHRGRPEQRRQQLRVNEPISCKGWLISLVSYDSHHGKTLVRMQARRAPGRIAALSGMVGIIICSACWCWWKKEETEVTA